MEHEVEPAFIALLLIFLSAVLLVSSKQLYVAFTHIPHIVKNSLIVMDLLERQRTTITLKIEAVRNLKSARLFITFSLNYSWCKMIIVERKMSVSDTMIPAKHLHERLLTESRAIHITIVTVLI